MAAMLPPPLPAAYSLRVQLFAPTAYGNEDKPLRSFRVVTDPESTIRDFCEDASRRHECMYGTAIAVKRCQDDQGFDLMQTDILGTLFTSGATIRMVQAHTLPNIRDSVPPTSALRFDPANLSGTKRNRPDSSPKVNGILPSSSYQASKRQRVADLDPDHPLPSLEEEPSRHNAELEARIIPNSQESVDLGSKSKRHGRSRVRPDFPHHIAETPPPVLSFSSSPSNSFRAASVVERTNSRKEIQESSPAPVRARSASSKPRRSEERRRQSSNRPTTSEIPTSLASAKHNSVQPELPQIHADQPRRASGGKATAVREDIYDQMPEDEGAAILKAKKAELSKKRRSLEDGSSNTPPSAQGKRQNSSKPGELPLTPNSRREAQRQSQERAAALEEQSRKEQQAKVFAEKAAKQRREAEEREAEERQIQDGLDVADRLLSEDGQIDPPEPEKVEKTTTAKVQETYAASERAVSSTSISPVATRGRKTSSPLLNRASSALSTTPFIPPGRKSALKQSPVRKDSSPPFADPTMHGVGIEQAMPLPKRKVSFHDSAVGKSTLSRPVIKPSLPVTPHPAAQKGRSSTNETSASEVPSEVSKSTKSKSKSITPEVEKSKPTPAKPASTSNITPRSTSTPSVIKPPSAEKNAKSITPVPQAIRPSSVSKAILPGKRSSTGAIVPSSRATPVSIKAQEPDWKRLVRENAERKREGSTTSPHSAVKPTSQVASRKAVVEINASPSIPEVKNKAVSKPLASNGKARAAPIQPKQDLSAENIVETSDDEEASESQSGSEAEEVVNEDETSDQEDGDEQEVEDEEDDSADSSDEIPDKIVEMARSKPAPKINGNAKSITPSASSAGARRSSIPQGDKEPPSKKSASNSNNEADLAKTKRATKSPSVQAPTVKPTTSQRSLTGSPRHSPQLPRLPTQTSINEAEIETQSNNDSSRDSRSPVVYNRQDELAARSASQPQKNAIESSQAEEVEDDSDSSEEDVEMPDMQAPQAKNGHQEDTAMPDVPTASDALQDSDSDSSSDYEEEPTTNLRFSSSLKSVDSGPRSNHLRPSNSKTHLSYSSPSGSTEDQENTQEEIDFQLISSLNEGHPSSSLAPPSSNIPRSQKSGLENPQSSLPNGNHKFSSPAPPKRPTMNFGARLSDLNANKLVPSSSAPALGKATKLNGFSKSSVKLKGTRGPNDDTSEEESDEENSDSDSDASSDSDEASKAPLSKLTRPSAVKPASSSQLSKNIRSSQPLKDSRPEAEDDDGSSDDSEDDSGSESEDQSISATQKLRNQLYKLKQSSQSRGSVESSRMGY